MNEQAQQQLAALRDRLTAGDSRLVQVPEIHTLLNLLDDAERERDKAMKLAAKEMAEHRQTILDYEASLESFRQTVDAKLAEVAERAATAADTRQAEIVAKLRADADAGDRNLAGLNRAMYPSTDAMIAAFRAAADSIERGAKKD